MIQLDFNYTDLNLPRGTDSQPNRSSISGAQDKVQLARRRGHFEVVAHGGTHILKPAPRMPIPRFATEVPVNECLTMDIASKVFGMNVAEHELVRFANGELAYLTKRFDIEKDRKRVQEDACQLLGRNARTHGPDYKYDASYEDLADLTQRCCRAYRIELPRIFDLILFDYAFSNGDAHLKNFSFFATDFGDYILTPAYDLLATSLHFPNESALALDLFKDGHYTAAYEARGFYSEPDFIELGACFGLAPNAVRNRLVRYAEAREQVAALVRSSLLSPAAQTAYLAAYLGRLRALAQK